MFKKISSININFLIILFFIFFKIPFTSCEYLKEQITKDKNFKDIKKEQNYFNNKNFIPPPDDNLMKEIQETRNKKNELEIKCQEKKIYVISLGVLSGIFLFILIVYCIFKCYIFCLSRNARDSLRMSKLDQVYLEDSFDLNKSKINEKNNNDNLENVNNIDKNDAPTCFSVIKNNNTFNPDKYDDENNNY